MLQTMENSQIYIWEKRVNFCVYLASRLTRVQEFQQTEIPNEHTGAIKSAIIVELGKDMWIWTGDTNGRIIIWTNVCILFSILFTLNYVR